MPKQQFDASSLAPLLDGSSAGELIPELARYGLQQLIELELAAFLGADWHERTEERIGHRNGYRPRTLTTQVGDLAGGTRSMPWWPFWAPRAASPSRR